MNGKYSGCRTSVSMLRAGMFALALTVGPLVHAAMVWSGPLITYNQPSSNPTLATNQDRITPDVWLTRAASKGLFNAFYETSATTFSPTNTEWAFGTLTNYASLKYTNWLAWLNGASPTTLVGQQAVMHLITDDIYISIKITLWNSGGSGGFAYQRSTPTPASLSGASINNGQFTFNYTADTGISYVVQSSSNLVDWVSLVTNVASASPVPFTDTANSSVASFYRVGRSAKPLISPLFSIVGIEQKNREQKTSLNLSLAMKTLKSTSIVCLHGILVVSLLAMASRVYATTVWDGPTVNFTHDNATGGLQDQWIPTVRITRGTNSGGLYNAAMETSAALGSPKDTKWAVGSLTNYSTLTYSNCPLKAGNNPPKYVGTSFVVHLVNEDIYLSLKLTAWGGAVHEWRKKFFVHTLHAAGNPANTDHQHHQSGHGAVFVAPANVTIQADAEVSSGTVTNVQFFTNSVLLGSVLTAPFTFTANNLAAGAYALTAVATAAGISATSTAVNITVNSPVLPPTVSITNPADGAVFAAPASVSLGADATVNGGTVTNVEFFANGASQGAVAVAPFTLIYGPLAAGLYALTAVATASGISATSAVVNVSVVNPVPVNLSGAMVNGGQFIFSYTADAGLTYVVQTSSNLVNWVSLVTNVAPGSPVLFTNALNPPGPGFYRVGRLPNP